MMEEIRQIDALLNGDEVERMVIDEHAQRPRRDGLPPVEPPPPRPNAQNVLDEVPAEEIPRPPSPAENAPILLDVFLEPPAAPAAVAPEDEGARCCSPSDEARHRYGAHRRLWRGRGRGNFHFREVRAGEPVRRRRGAREFTQSLGMLSRQAFRGDDY
ncbi:hypothetical protein QAD02_013757 [Eretmocerus hayati]|uniref:Uncharacterized protein n=1 Tax=Eretmocerus hayati TaxID=131215 RepID=A0ACC2P862_9HYME|nr:hypothetical protein QAD02_013757 [Eretmocerus hayati]